MTKRHADTLIVEDQTTAAPPPKRARHDIPTDKETIEKIQSWVRSSYKKNVLDQIPKWLQEQSFTLYGPIRWDDKEVGLTDYMYDRPLWTLATKYVKDEPDDAHALAFWLLYYGARHVEFHYGSYELQVLLFSIINYDDLGENFHFKVAKAWRELDLETVRYTMNRDKQEKLFKAVDSILTHRTQIIHFQPTRAGNIVASLRYHGLVESWHIKDQEAVEEKKDEIDD